MPRPSKPFDAINQNALRALDLAERHHEALEPRLTAGVIDLLRQDLERLGALIPKVTQVQNETIATTARQNVKLAQAYELVKAARFAVQRKRRSPDVRKAYGVGRNLNPALVKNVTAALDQIIDAAVNDPEEARAIGLLTRDVDAMRAALNDLRGADTAQERARASAPLTTRERNQLGRRVLQAVDDIVSAARLEFVASPDDWRPFESLIALGNRKPRTPRTK